MKPYAMVLPSTAFFGSSVGNFFVKSFNTGEAYLLLLLVFAFVMTYGLGYLIMCKISPRYKETMNPPLEQVQVRKSDDKTEDEEAEEETGGADGEEGVRDDLNEKDDEETAEDRSGDVVRDSRDDEQVLGKTEGGTLRQSSRTDSLRKRNAPLRKSEKPTDAPEEEEEEEMEISPLLEDVTEPKKKK